MIKKLKLLILSLSSLILFAVPLAATATVSAANTVAPDINGNLNCGSDIKVGSSSGCNATDTSGAINNTISTVINVISVIVGAVAVIMIIVGGFRYVTSAGNPEGAKSARSTILYAIIGLVVVALAQLIVHFVLNKTTTATS